MPKSSKPKRTTIEDLAAITSRGFELIEGRLDSLEKKTDLGFAHVNARLDQVRRDIAGLDDLNKRVRHLEKLMRVAH
ncbi:MAG: hypothetical protein U1A16_02345 [Patescibacteria group bacterium]|nr:hypothetical protein [Patescibacteria group bacterium]